MERDRQTEGYMQRETDRGSDRQDKERDTQTDTDRGETEKERNRSRPFIKTR